MSTIARSTSADRLRKLSSRFRYGHFFFVEPGRSGDVFKKGRQWANILDVAAQRLLYRDVSLELYRRSRERLVKLAERFENGEVAANFVGRSGDVKKLCKQWGAILRSAIAHFDGFISDGGDNEASI